MSSEAPDGSILVTLLGKELRELVRDGRFWIVGVAVLGLLLATLGFSFREAESARTERSAAQSEADQHFRTQDEKNPHVAAHYGTYVFKPTGALSFVNPGVDAFVGVSLKLEAHKRNPLQGARARDATALARLGRLSAASVLELLVPLLVIGLGFAAWTSERERGTLRQVASLGVLPRSLFLGKLGGLLVALAVVLVPAALVCAWIIGALSREGVAAPGATQRLFALTAAYALYVLVWALLTLLVSARAHSSRAALVTLLGLWIFASLIVPRLSADAALTLVNVPSQSEVAAGIREGLEKGAPGGPPREQRIAAFTEKLLQEQGFAGAEMLMDAALLNGIELQAEAYFENEIIDHHFAILEQALDRQESLGQLFGVLSPVLAARSLSMALAGTDAAHHRYFAARAEHHRRSLVDLLNREFAEKGGAAGFDYKAGRELWERAPAFEYVPPALGWVFARQRFSVGLLVAWLVFAGAGALSAVARIRVV